MGRLFPARQLSIAESILYAPVPNFRLPCLLESVFLDFVRVLSATANGDLHELTELLACVFSSHSEPGCRRRGWRHSGNDWSDRLPRWMGRRSEDGWLSQERRRREVWRVWTSFRLKKGPSSIHAGAGGKMQRGENTATFLFFLLLLSPVSKYVTPPSLLFSIRATAKKIPSLPLESRFSADTASTA